MLRFCTGVLATLFVFTSQALAAIEVGQEFPLPNSALAPIRPAPWYEENGSVQSADGRVEVSRCGDNYLVVWGGADGGVYAARITASGDVIDTLPLRIAEEGNAPAVASNGETCLVVWASRADLTAILGVRLTFDAAPLDVQPIAIARGTNAELSFPIQVAYPFVATDGADYLVSYWAIHSAKYFSANGAAIVARDGTLLSLNNYDLYWSSGSSSGGPMWAEWEIASNGDVYLLAYYEQQSGPNTIWYRCTTSGCRFYVGPTVYTAPIAAASDGSGFLVLFEGPPGKWYQYESIEPAALRVAWLSADPFDGGAVPSVVLEEGTSQTQMGPAFPVVAAYEGKQYLAIWFTPDTAPTQAFGAVLPVSNDGTSPVREALFSGEISLPAIAPSGKGTSLLVYAVPSASDSAVKEVRGRVIITDSTPPLVSVPASLSMIATSNAGSVVTFSVSAEDDYSGTVQAMCLPSSGSLFAPGATRVNCMALDAAGNVGSAAFDVFVSYSWSGVLEPVDAQGRSVFKLGRTVPFKFMLTGASAGISTLDAKLFLAKVSEEVIGTEEAALPVSGQADAGNSFRYDSSGIYIFNLATGAMSAGTWRVRVALGDGVDHAVLMSLKP